MVAQCTAHTQLKSVYDVSRVAGLFLFFAPAYLATATCGKIREAEIGKAYNYGGIIAKEKGPSGCCLIVVKCMGSAFYPVKQNYRMYYSRMGRMSR